MNLKVIEKKPAVSYPQLSIEVELEGYKIQADVHSYTHYGKDKPTFSASTVGIVFPNGGSVFLSLEHLQNLEAVFNRKTVSVLRAFKAALDIELEGLNGNYPKSEN